MRVILVGQGQMGKMFYEMALKDPEIEIAFMMAHFIYNQSMAHVDVLVDFSHPDNLEGILEYGLKYHIPLVLGTTGYSKEQLLNIKKAGKEIAILQEANFSLGIALVKKILELVTPILSNFDIEIIESHHALKKDAPSGTVSLLLDSIRKTRDINEIYDRIGESLRIKNEIGVHSIRGGSIAGDHRILYLGDDENISIEHSSSSKRIYIKGAFQAMKFIIKKTEGYYTMEDVLFEPEGLWKQKKS